MPTKPPEGVGRVWLHYRLCWQTNFSEPDQTCQGHRSTPKAMAQQHTQPVPSPRSLPGTPLSSAAPSSSPQCSVEVRCHRCAALLQASDWLLLLQRLLTSPNMEGFLSLTCGFQAAELQLVTSPQTVPGGLLGCSEFAWPSSELTLRSRFLFLVVFHSMRSFCLCTP